MLYHPWSPNQLTLFPSFISCTNFYELPASSDTYKSEKFSVKVVSEPSTAANNLEVSEGEIAISIRPAGTIPELASFQVIPPSVAFRIPPHQCGDSHLADANWVLKFCGLLIICCTRVDAL